MKVTCALCDSKYEIEDRSSLAKKMKNHPILMYLCDSCHQDIKKKRLQEQRKE